MFFSWRFWFEIEIPAKELTRARKRLPETLLKTAADLCYFHLV